MTPEEIKAAEAQVAAAEAVEEAARVAAAEALAKSIGKTDKEKDADMVKRLVEERVAAELAEVKSKLNNAYKARDEATAKNAEFERKEREANLKRLEEEGKHKEVYEIKLAEQQARLDASERRTTELTRDVSVRNALGSLTFKNAAAIDMAYREITAQLIQDGSGNWVHRTGIAISDFVESFAKNDDMAFLFKAKVSQGANVTGKTTDGKVTSERKSLFNMSQAEVIKMAAEGKLK